MYQGYAKTPLTQDTFALDNSGPGAQLKAFRPCSTRTIFFRTTEPKTDDSSRLFP